MLLHHESAARVFHSFSEKHLSLSAPPSITEHMKYRTWFYFCFPLKLKYVAVREFSQALYTCRKSRSIPKTACQVLGNSKVCVTVHSYVSTLPASRKTNKGPLLQEARKCWTILATPLHQLWRGHFMAFKRIHTQSSAIHIQFAFQTFQTNKMKPLTLSLEMQELKGKKKLRDGRLAPWNTSAAITCSVPHMAHNLSGP